jgi:hypothetical protein
MPALAERVAEEARVVAAEEAQRKAEESAKELEAIKAERVATVEQQTRAAMTAAKADLVARRIDKEEYSRRIASAQTERGQRLSAIERNEESEPSGSEHEVMEAESALLGVKAPTKRKSDDSMAGLLPVAGKVSNTYIGPNVC